MEYSMGTEIFLPMFYMVLLTTVVFLLATSLRLKEIYLNKIMNKQIASGKPTAGEAPTQGGEQRA